MQIVDSNTDTIIAVIKIQDYGEVTISTIAGNPEVILKWDYVNKDGTCGTNYVKGTAKGGYYMNKNLREKKSNKGWKY